MVGQNRCKLQQEVLRQYADGKLSAGRGAELLGVSSRDFLDLLEREGLVINWNFEGVRRYRKLNHSWTSTYAKCEMLERVKKRYGLKLPMRVIAIDYGEDVGDLFVRFRHAEQAEGEATADGKVIVHYDEKGKIAAIEITNIATL